MRTQSLDTSPEFERMYIAHIRTFSAAKKFRSVRSWTQSIRSANMSATHGSSDTRQEQDRAVQFVTREYGSELAKLFRHEIEQRSDWTRDAPDLQEALLPLLDGIEHIGVRSLLIGSVACSVYGLPRATHDVDVLTDLHQEQLPLLFESLTPSYLFDQEAVALAVQQRMSFSLLHVSRLIKMDVFLSSTSFDAAMLKHGKAISLMEGRAPSWIASAEDLALMLLQWYQQRGKQADDQWNDLLGLLKVQAPTLDLPYLYQQAKLLHVGDLCTQALIDAGIWEQEPS
jgi:hypothetical protein